jgi:hypothetical protein
MISNQKSPMPTMHPHIISEGGGQSQHDRHKSTVKGLSPAWDIFDPSDDELWSPLLNVKIGPPRGFKPNEVVKSWKKIKMS